ncbi:hypothetical protein ACJ41O_004917 [Fusarium nematophilum]
MRLSTVFIAIAIAAEAVAGAATSSCDCKDPIVRKEWRTLSKKQKNEYISAVKCLATKPSQTGNIYEGAKSRFDDFQGTHIVNTDFVHFVGFFQAWHRVFVAQYEKDLRDLCGYKGAQPYWNWALDSKSVDGFLNSPVFDRATGFGGCIVDGPFMKGKFAVNMGPGLTTAYNPRCLTRDIAPEFAISKLSQAVVDWTLKAKDFYEFDIRVEGGITVPEHRYHGGGHLGVGGDIGEVGDVYSSPGDPLFFMHHANMDRLWDKWQRLDWPRRKSDIGGPDTQFAYPFAFFGDKEYRNVTLDYKMNFDKLVPGKKHLKIRQVMDTQGGELCYTYQ